MTAPRYADCKCGHPRNAHPDEYEESCAVPNCVCQEYIPNTLRPIENVPILVQSAPVAATVPDVSEDDDDESPSILARARRSPFKRTAALAEKITELLAELAQRLEDESAQAEAMREIAALERKLAEAKAKLRGNAPVVAVTTRAAPAKRTNKPKSCPDCGHTSPSGAGLSAHRRFQHGWSKDEAVS